MRFARTNEVATSEFDRCLPLEFSSSQDDDDDDDECDDDECDNRRGIKRGNRIDCLEDTHVFEDDSEGGSFASVCDWLESNKPDIAVPISVGSLPDLMYHGNSVKHAAEMEVKERLYRLSIHMLIASFSSNYIHDTELPDDVVNLTRQRNAESDANDIYARR